MLPGDACAVGPGTWDERVMCSAPHPLVRSYATTKHARRSCTTR